MGTSLEELLDQIHGMVVTYSRYESASVVAARHGIIDRVRNMLNAGKITSLRKQPKTFGFVNKDQVVGEA